MNTANWVYSSRYVGALIVGVVFLFTSTVYAENEIARLDETVEHIEEKTDSSPVSVSSNLSNKKLSNTQTASSKRINASLINGALTSLVGLVFVLGLFFILVYLSRLFLPNRTLASSATGTIEVIDSCFVGGKSSLLTLRWGSKALLVARMGDNWTLLSETHSEDEAQEILATVQASKEYKKEKKRQWSGLIMKNNSERKVQ